MSIKPSLKLFKRAGVMNSAFPEYLTSLVPGLISLWIPGEDGRAIDVIGQNHGTVHGANRNVEVYPNQIRNDLGWSFDGVDDRINCGNVDITKLKSIFALVKPIASQPWHNVIAGKIDVKNGKYFGLRSYANENKFQLVSTAGLTTDTSSFSINTFYFVCGVIKQNNGYLYVNSILKGTGIGGVSSNSTKPFLIGAGYDSANTMTYYWKGEISIVGVSSISWGTSEISNLYNAIKDLFYPRG